MIHKHNSTRTGSARPAEYTIKQQAGQWRIYDKQQRFRCSFATLPAAQAYVAMRTPTHQGNASTEQQAT